MCVGAHRHCDYTFIQSLRGWKTRLSSLNWFSDSAYVRWETHWFLKHLLYLSLCRIQAWSPESWLCLEEAAKSRDKLLCLQIFLLLNHLFFSLVFFFYSALTSLISSSFGSATFPLICFAVPLISAQTKDSPCGRWWLSQAAGIKASMFFLSNTLCKPGCNWCRDLSKTHSCAERYTSTHVHTLPPVIIPSSRAVSANWNFQEKQVG